MCVGKTAGALFSSSPSSTVAKWSRSRKTAVLKDRKTAAAGGSRKVGRQSGVEVSKLTSDSQVQLLVAGYLNQSCGSLFTCEKGHCVVAPPFGISVDPSGNLPIVL